MRAIRIEACEPLGTDRLTRAVQDLRTERVCLSHSGGEHILPRSGKTPYSERDGHLIPSERVILFRARGKVSLKKRLLTRRLKLQYHLHPYDYNQ